MTELIFGAFILAYGLLTISHKESHARAYKLFAFGFLVSILYASVYVYYPNVFPIFMLLFTSLAILTQYFHIRAVDSGRVKGTKLIANVGVHHDLEKIKAAEKKKAKR